jgi:hypothetical protein
MSPMRGVVVDERVSVRGDSEVRPSSVAKPDRQRFVTACLAGVAVGTVPFLWVLWDLWSGGINVLRRAGGGQIFDLQAHAIIHGHLWVPNGRIGLEAFVHDGRQYTYFGILPSLLRIPVLAVAPRLEGELSAPSMLLAYFVICLFLVLLSWRVRVMMRGDAVVGRAEAVSIGVLMASITGGSVILFLGATPWIYHEDLMWSIGLTLGSIFAICGIMERPSWRRVLLTGFLVLLINLSRLTTSWACVTAVVLLAAWFAFGRTTADRRRWAVPVLLAGMIPLAIGSAITWIKFGAPFGLPMQNQLWTSMNLHRRQFLAANGGHYYGLKFLPSTLLTYLSPANIRLTGAFPFITLPAAPPHLVGNIIIDSAYRTASATATMPLLCLLTLLGGVAVFKRRATAGAKALRIPFVAMLIPPAITFVWGYIDPRFLADFMPLLILGGIIGLIELWRIWETRPPRAHTFAVVGVVALGIFSMAANLGGAITPTPQWTEAQLTHFVSTQKTVGSLVGQPLADRVIKGSRLPYWAAADELFIVGNCRAMYISNGQDFSTVPKQQLQHRTWMSVGEEPGVRHRVLLTFHGSIAALGRGVPVLSVGRDTIWVEPAGRHRIRFRSDDPKDPRTGGSVRVELGRTYGVWIATDQNLQSLHINMNRRLLLNGVLTASGPVVVHTQPGTAPDAALSVSQVSLGTPDMSMCQSLLRS